MSRLDLRQRVRPLDGHVFCARPRSMRPLHVVQQGPFAIYAKCGAEAYAQGPSFAELHEVCVPCRAYVITTERWRTRGPRLPGGDR